MLPNIGEINYIGVPRILQWRGFIEETTDGTECGNFLKGAKPGGLGHRSPSEAEAKM